MTVLFIFSCTSSIIEKGEWEGIRDSALRVYVTLDIPEDFSAATVPDRMTERILNAGKKRAGLLLTGYLQEKITDPDRADSCRSAITRIINTGTIIHHECGEDICEAFMDFNIKEFIESAHGPTAP